MDDNFKDKNIVEFMIDGTISNVNAHIGDYLLLGDLILTLKTSSRYGEIEVPIVATIDGYLENINVKIGEKVRANQPLAIINPNKVN